jgi:hypothetical protein
MAALSSHGLINRHYQCRVNLHRSWSFISQPLVLAYLNTTLVKTLHRIGYKYPCKQIRHFLAKVALFSSGFVT